MDYKKQALYNTIGNLVYMICLWLLSVLTVRLSGFADAGVLSLAMSIGNIFYFIAVYGIRSFQASDATHQYGAMVYFKTRIVTVTASVGLCVAYLCLCGYDFYASTTIFLYLLFRCLEACSDALFGELQKVGHLEICGVSMSAKGLLSVVVFSVLLYWRRNLNVAMIAVVLIAAAFLLFYDIPGYKRYRDINEMNLGGTTKQLLRAGFPMLLTTVFPIIITAIPRLQLEQQYGKEILGIYSSISTPTVLITTIIPNMLCPFMTYYGICYQEKQYGRILKMMWLSILCTAVLGAVACIAAYFLGDLVLGLVFGGEVLPYVYVFIPLIAATTVYAFSMCGNSVLITIRHPFWLTLFAGVALLISFLISGTLVRRYGMMGTVWAFGAPFAVQLILQLAYVTYKLRFDKAR